ncbi:MAG: guanylate kinase [Agathobacter sp.]|nr:guanylate kinase [Agathobacter sp.]
MSSLKKGILVVVSGFSGSGKGTIMKKLMEKYSDKYALSVSATTRDPRPGEEHGVDYFFVTKEEFEDMIQKGALVEYAQYVSNYYGTPKAYVEEQLSAGKSVILEIEIQGALKIKEQFPDTLLLFVTAPSAEELKNRLTGRGTETPEVIAARLSRAVEESQGMEEYDYLVINDKIDETVDLVDTIIEGQKNQNTEGFSNLSLSSNINFVNKLREELSGFSKGE